MQKQHWAVVLAAGSGTRLQEMTGRFRVNAVPKQYCSLYGGASLLRLAVARAFAVVPRDRVLCVVAEEHEQWWRRELDNLPDENVIVQPQNRGTAVGTLLPLLVARSRDSSSRLIYLPADHYVSDEDVMTSAISTVLQALEQNSQKILMLGLEPNEADPEFGYILSSGSPEDDIRPVTRFVEKPTLREARQLIRQGALWNSFVFAAQSDCLLSLLRARIPLTVGEFEPIFEDPLGDKKRLAEVYRNLAVADLSSQVFTGSEDSLATLRVPACGWTDLGTPERVMRCLSADKTTATIPRVKYARRATHVALASVCGSA